SGVFQVRLAPRSGMLPVLCHGAWTGLRGAGAGRPTRIKGGDRMADWRKVALSAFLADGVIDETEVKILKKELWADGKIDKDEVEFLIDLRNLAQKKAKKEGLRPAFERLFFKAIEENVMADGTIDDEEARWLRT